MAEPHVPDVSPEDIVNGTATESLRLEQEADAIIARNIPPRPLRQAVREDAAEARAWADHRVKHARDAIREEPVRAILYALGLGVVIGLLAAR